MDKKDKQTCLLFLMLKMIKNYEINIYDEIKNRVFILIISHSKLSKKEELFLTKKNSFALIKNINNYIKYKHVNNVIIDCKNNTYIKNDIFSYSEIENLFLPKQINNLSAFCFNTSHITNINLENVLILNQNCFQNCYYLNEITLSKNMLQLDNEVFLNCANLRTVIFPENSNLINIKNGAFRNCINLKKINIPDSVNEIETGNEIMADNFIYI